MNLPMLCRYLGNLNALNFSTTWQTNLNTTHKYVEKYCHVLRGQFRHGQAEREKMCVVVLDGCGNPGDPQKVAS